MSSPTPSILSPSEGRMFVAGPFTITTRVAGAQTGGAFEMYELALGKNETIDYHVHETMDETLYVFAGQIEFNVAGTKSLQPAGAVAFVPRGIHHGFTNPGPAEARVLVLFNPAGNQHEYFAALETLFAAPRLDTAALASLQARYDQALVPPEGSG